jgi:hypothetical protein
MIRVSRSQIGSQAASLEAAIQRRLDLLKPQIEAEMKEIARKAAVELANATFPTGPKPQPVALAAIARDVSRVFTTAGQVYGFLRVRRGPEMAKAFYRAWKQNDFARSLKVLRAAGGDFARLEFGPVSSALHEAARSGPRRRVTLQFPIRIVPEADKAAYIAKVQKQLGQAASGWSACAASLGGESGIPAWKSTAVHGTAYGNVRPMQGTKIGFILRNVSPHAARNLPPSEAAAIASRASKKLIESLMNPR